MCVCNILGCWGLSKVVIKPPVSVAVDAGRWIRGRELPRPAAESRRDADDRDRIALMPICRGPAAYPLINSTRLCTPHPSFSAAPSNTSSNSSCLRSVAEATRTFSDITDDIKPLDESLPQAQLSILLEVGGGTAHDTCGQHSKTARTYAGTNKNRNLKYSYTWWYS